MVREQIMQIFKKTFPGVGAIDDSTGSSDIREWDSLRHVLLIAEVEKAFKIRFELMELLQMKTFGDICKKVEQKIS